MIYFVRNHVFRQFFSHSLHHNYMHFTANSCENYFLPFALYIIQLGHMAAICYIKIQYLSHMWHKEWYISLEIMISNSFSVKHHNYMHFTANSCENYFSQFTLYIIQLGHMAAILNFKILHLSHTWHKEWYISLKIMFSDSFSVIHHNYMHFMVKQCSLLWK